MGYQGSLPGKYIQEGAGKSLARQEGNKLQWPNSGFIQHIPHEAQYTS